MPVAIVFFFPLQKGDWKTTQKCGGMDTARRGREIRLATEEGWQTVAGETDGFLVFCKQ